MAQVNRISSFKSFTEVKNQEATMKLRETNNAKRQETVGKIGAILDEMGLTSLSELDEEKKQALINKMFGNVSEDEAEDIEDEINKLGEPKKLEEGNAFIFAAGKAKQEGKSSFEFNGKTYKVTLKKDTGLKEGNAFGAAVKKAKEDDEDEFEIDGETYEIEEAKRSKFTGKTANDLYTQIGGKPVEVFVGNDWYSVNPEELKGDKGDSFIGYTQDGSDHEFYLKDISFIQESLNEGKHGMAKKLLKGIVDGDSSEAEGIKLSKELADHYLNWISTSAFGKKNENLPLNMLINASFNWGIERQLDPKLKGELEALKASQKKNESIVNEARSIAKIQYDWSKLTTTMQATAQNWKAAEGSAKEMLLGKLKEMTAQKKALEAELDATIADKDKDLELVVSEAFYRLPKDVIGTELYVANQNLQSLYNNTSAGSDVDPKALDSIIKNLQQVKSLTKKFNSKEEVAGTVYEGEVLLFDEIGTELEALKKKISVLMKSATDKKWVSALGAASSTLSNLDRNLSQSDSKLGAIITEADLYEGKAKDLKPNHKYTSDYGEVTFIKLNPDGKTMKLHSKETGEIKTDISNAYNMELIESVVNEADTVKSEAISRLADFFRISPYALSKFNFDGNDNIKELTKVLNSTSDAGTKLYYDTCIKLAKKDLGIDESTVNEAEKFKSTEDFEEFLEEIDGMPEVRIKRIMGKDYIDTPGGFRDEADDYDNDIVEYTLSNMGRKDFEALKAWWENNVQESLTEGQDPSAEKTSRAEQLKKLKAFKARQEETEKLKKLQAKRAKAAGSAKESVVAEGKDDYMARSGNADINIKKGYKHLVEYELDELYNKLGALSKEYKIKGITATFESVVNEAEVSSDDEFKEYAMSVLKKAFGDDFDEAKAGEVVDGILKKCGDDYGAAVGMLTSSLGESVVTEAFDANYWEDYQEGAQKMKNPTGMQIQQSVEAAVEDWNDNNENGKENEVTSAGEKKVLKLAKEFVKAKGYISFDIIDAMIAQES